MPDLLYQVKERTGGGADVCVRVRVSSILTVATRVHLTVTQGVTSLFIIISYTPSYPLMPPYPYPSCDDDD